MTSQYWQAREDEIAALRDYALSFNLEQDLANGVWLRESGDQLLEIAFQLHFVGNFSDSLQLAGKSVEYYLAALRRESVAPISDPAMAHVYHGLYYARWWTISREPTGLLHQAATAYCAGLVAESPPVDAAAYARATWYWLELGEIGTTIAWLSLAESVENQSGNHSPGVVLARQVVNQCWREGCETTGPCEVLDKAIAAAIDWDQPSGGTMWMPFSW